jgi:predicted HTH transcriptional regulator
LELIKENPYITRKKLAQEIGYITEDGIKYHLAKLKKRKNQKSWT